MSRLQWPESRIQDRQQGALAGLDMSLPREHESNRKRTCVSAWPHGEVLPLRRGCKRREGQRPALLNCQRRTKALQGETCSSGGLLVACTSAAPKSERPLQL